MQVYHRLVGATERCGVGLAMSSWGNGAEGTRIPLIASGLVFAVHLAANPHYGFFRDELYFIVCGRHPAFGYVDQPPLVPLLAAATQLFGESLFLLRASAAVFAAASVYVTCKIARELGGGRFAQWLAALGSALCPVLCAFGMKISTDTVGLWVWPLAALYLLRVLRGGDPRNWIGVGLSLGVSAEAKVSVVYFAGALLVGLLCTPGRRVLWSRWCAAGALCGVAAAFPAFAWQAAHGFPMLEVLRNGQRGKNVVLSPGAYLLAELLITNPVLSLLWLAGLWQLWARAETRALAIGFVVLIAAMIVSHAKHYYPADAYPPLFAAGGVAVERLAQGRRFVRSAAIACAALAGIAATPYVLPILPLRAFLAYHQALAPLFHLEATQAEVHRPSALPQDFADMQGWPELAAAVGKVLDSLPPADRARAAIVTQNYGQAAALDFFGWRHRLPPALSGHNQYFLWGPRGYDGNVLIDLGGDCGKGDHLFERSDRAAIFESPLSMPYEDRLPIMVCRGIRRPLTELWPSLKFYW
jgi:4-amino-4-deoxy-L-arabinose transferase-like glycosyltransferase